LRLTKDQRSEQAIENKATNDHLDNPFNRVALLREQWRLTQPNQRIPAI